MRWQVVIASLLLSGCSLPSALSLPALPTLPAFRKLPGAGPPGAEKVGAGIYRVALAPSAAAKCETADACTLVAAAEAAKRVGGTHFMVLPGHGGPSQSGYAYIKVFTLETPEGLPSGAVSVEEVLYFLDKREKPPATGSS